MGESVENNTFVVKDDGTIARTLGVCPHCKQETEIDGQYCKYCGKPIDMRCNKSLLYVLIALSLVALILQFFIEFDESWSLVGWGLGLISFGLGLWIHRVRETAGIIQFVYDKKVRNIGKLAMAIDVIVFIFFALYFYFNYY